MKPKSHFVEFTLQQWNLNSGSVYDNYSVRSWRSEAHNNERFLSYEREQMNSYYLYRPCYKCMWSSECFIVYRPPPVRAPCPLAKRKIPQLNTTTTIGPPYV